MLSFFGSRFYVLDDGAQEKSKEKKPKKSQKLEAQRNDRSNVNEGPKTASAADTATAKITDSPASTSGSS